MNWLLLLLAAAWGTLGIGLLWSGRPLKALVTRLGRLRARLTRFRHLRKVPGKPEDGDPLDAEEKTALRSLLASYRCLTVDEPVYRQQRGRRP